PAATHLDATDVGGAEGLDHRADAVVAAGAPFHANAYRAEREIDVVIDQDQIVATGPEPPQGARDHRPAHVHEGQRLDQGDVLAAPPAHAHQGAVVAPPGLASQRLLRDVVQHTLAHVVAGVPVLLAGVPESH